MTNLDKFVETYKNELKQFIRLNPELYWVNFDKVTNFFKEELEDGLYVKQETVFKATCRRLGIKQTYKEINEFLKG